MGMRASLDCFAGPTTLVDKMIGNAFKTVEAVALHLKEIKYLAYNMDAIVAAANASTVSGGSSTVGGGSSTTIVNPVVPVTKVAASGSTRVLTFPSSGSACFDITLTADCAFTFAGGVTGQQQTMSIVLRQDSTAGHTATFTDAILWPGGTPPTPNTQAGRVDLFLVTTPDARATLFGNY
jgi:hypothetical protein